MSFRKTASKNHGVSAVKAAPLDPAAVAARFIAAAPAAGFRVEPFGATMSGPLIALTRRTPGLRPRIYLSAGIHGDEPAPPLTLLEMLEAGRFDTRANWFICPLLNPNGLARGVEDPLLLAVQFLGHVHALVEIAVGDAAEAQQDRLPRVTAVADPEAVSAQFRKCCRGADQGGGPGQWRGIVRRSGG